MKQKKYIFAILLIALIWIPTSVLNAQTLYENTCPRSTFKIDFLQKYTTVCSNKNNMRIIAAENMKQEVKDFYETNIERINQDNQSNPNFVAHNAIQELRQHKKCLIDICHNTFAACNESLVNISNTYEGQEWCNQKTEELFELGKTNTVYTINSNFARKDRSLTKQKLTAIATRFQYYWEYWMNQQVIPHLKDFIDSTPFFIRYPA